MRRGLPASAFDGTRPHIAIANTASDLVPCNMHLTEVARSVANGIHEAGGIPLESPVMGLGETLVRPTAMLWRNLAAMQMEEMFRANPVDGVVRSAAATRRSPRCSWPPRPSGSPRWSCPAGRCSRAPSAASRWVRGTDVWKLSEDVRGGGLSEQDFLASESSMIRSKGHCNTMGTASTMGLVAEALGMVSPGLAGTPAPDARLLEGAHASGRRIVEMVGEELAPRRVITEASVRNAIVALAAIGGSTNAVVHLLAIAGRLGLDISLDDFDSVGADVPPLVNLQPSGENLMDDLFRAGGFLAVLKEVRDLLDPGALTVSGRPLVDHLEDARAWDPDVIAAREDPLQEKAGIAVSRGDLAPGGAIVKPSAATPAALRHRGPAVVFDSIEDFRARIDDPDLEVEEDSVLVLRGRGPKGYPGMPEVSNMPLPRKPLERGVRDMVRICDGRMSGTAYGTVVVARDPGGGRRRAAGPRAHRRHHRPGRRRAPPRRRGRPRGARRPHAERGDPRRLRRPREGLAEALRRARHPGGHRRRPRLPRRIQRLRGVARVALSPRDAPTSGAPAP
uniref:dihydroxy-acid dehydratase n=1 Tax=Brachybacterium sp. GPGPB12 TaxID=3023517 RepID=UPI00404A2AE0